MPMRAVRAFPFTPGVARGRVRRGAAAATPDDLAVVHFREVGQLQVKPAGLAVIDGAPFSHAMIRLLALGVPSVILTDRQAASLPTDEELRLDGGSGLIASSADVQTAGEDSRPPAPATDRVTTADGIPISLRASVAEATGASLAIANGASAIGLVRTEYLIPQQSETPHTEFFERAFGELCRAAAPLPVTLRLLDLAPDKRPPWFNDQSVPLNPLGLQGVRLFDSNPVRKVIDAQLRAVKRVAPGFDLSLLVPFVTDPQEFLHWRRHIADTAGAQIPVGAMAETPGSLLMLPELLDLADFVAIGTNDLMQAVFAADRDLPVVARYLDPYSPALFRLLDRAALLSERRLERVQLCGLVPQLPGLLPVLVGLGFRHFSVEPPMIPWLAQGLSRIHTADAGTLARAVCGAHNAAEVRDLTGA